MTDMHRNIHVLDLFAFHSLSLVTLFCMLLHYKTIYKKSFCGHFLNQDIFEDSMLRWTDGWMHTCLTCFDIANIEFACLNCKL